jgi:hypothetical protein
MDVPRYYGIGIRGSTARERLQFRWDIIFAVLEDAELVHRLATVNTHEIGRREKLKNYRPKIGDQKCGYQNSARKQATTIPAEP